MPDTGSVAFATATTLASEAALALYPILIKTVPVSLQTQLLARLGTYTVAAMALAPRNELSIPFSFSSLGLGLMNFTHILASYLSYLYLPAGTALALFYTYPFFNILAGLIFLGDRFRLWAVPLLLLAFVGVVLIALYTQGTEGFTDTASADTEPSAETDRDTDLGPKGNGKGGAGRRATERTAEGSVSAVGTGSAGAVILGVLLSLLSAITESAIFLLAKSPGATPTGTMLRLYPAALVPLAAWLLFRPGNLAASLPQAAILIGFNLVVGFLGYFLRMFSIPILPTAVFSVLTFVGVIAGYLWGLVFAKEVPTAGALAGSGLIAAAVGLLRFFKI
jgi:drug/metabolite transporter (DMT)-like permease